MKFQDSGLPKDKLIEEAFNFSYANLMHNKKEILRNFAQQIGAIHAQNIEILDAERAKSGMPEEDYKREKAMLEKIRDQQLTHGPQRIDEQLERAFAARRLAPALEIAQHADGKTPALMAALLLMDCVRSPIDHRKVEKQFGRDVAGLIADVVHIDAYPSEREVNLGQAATDTKRAYLALLITTVEQLAQQIQQAKTADPAQMPFFPPGQEEQFFRNAKITWGNDAKLDARFADAFNKAAEAVSSSVRMDTQEQSAPRLVRAAPKNPAGPGPKGPGGGNGGLGGDVF